MNAEQMKNAILAAVAGICSVIANQLGGWDASMKVLIALMISDYVTGIMVAAIWHRSAKSESGALDSKASFKGLLKKGVILLLVWLGVLLDGAIGAKYIRTAIIIFFIGNEGISLLENIGLMGVPYPEFLKKALEAMREKGEKGDAS